MLTSKDLMIGDWVKFPIGNEKIIDLPYIPGKGICPSFAASATLFPVEVEKLQPIPLTAEILEKNFSSTPEWYFDGTNKYCLRISRYKNKWNFYYGRGSNGVQVQINIQYVHELQHCLRLCGIEHEITL